MPEDYWSGLFTGQTSFYCDEDDSNMIINDRYYSVNYNKRVCKKRVNCNDGKIHCRLLLCQIELIQIDSSHQMQWIIFSSAEVVFRHYYWQILQPD